MTAASATSLITHEITGAPDAPVILALGGISASRHVAASAAHPAPGWWEGIAGDGCALDTLRRRVLGVDFLDGGRAEDGRPASIVTTHDQAAAVVDLLDVLGVDQLDAVVGASYGGMVALALAERWPERVRRAVVICAAHESTAMSTALRAIQRRIVELGLATGSAREGMIAARALAMTTYRTAEELAARFGTAVTVQGREAVFDVERYLVRAGEKFAERMAPERFLALSLSADLHRVVPERVRVPVSVVEALHDSLVPAAQTDQLARRLPQLRQRATLYSHAGHDAFLVEPARLTSILTSALAA